MDGKNSHLNPYLILVLGVIGISFSSIFTRLATAPPPVIAFYRLALTVLLLAPFLLRSSGIAELKILALLFCPCSSPHHLRAYGL